VKSQCRTLFLNSTDFLGPQTNCRSPRSVTRPKKNSPSGCCYFGGGGGEKISRLRPGSGFGFGLGAFFTSFLPLSLFPMHASMTHKARA
jgi:hypothetical protein